MAPVAHAVRAGGDPASDGRARSVGAEAPPNPIAQSRPVFLAARVADPRQRARHTRLHATPSAQCGGVIDARRRAVDDGGQLERQVPSPGRCRDLIIDHSQRLTGPGALEDGAEEVAPAPAVQPACAHEVRASSRRGPPAARPSTSTWRRHRGARQHRARRRGRRSHRRTRSRSRCGRAWRSPRPQRATLPAPSQFTAKATSGFVSAWSTWVYAAQFTTRVGRVLLTRSSTAAGISHITRPPGNQLDVVAVMKSVGKLLRQHSAAAEHERSSLAYGGAGHGAFRVSSELSDGARCKPRARPIGCRRCMTVGSASSKRSRPGDRPRGPVVSQAGTSISTTSVGRSPVSALSAEWLRWDAVTATSPSGWRRSSRALASLASMSPMSRAGCIGETRPTSVSSRWLRKSWPACASLHRSTSWCSPTRSTTSPSTIVPSCWRRCASWSLQAVGSSARTGSGAGTRPRSPRGSPIGTSLVTALSSTEIEMTSSGRSRGPARGARYRG